MHSDFQTAPTLIVDASGQKFGRFRTAPLRTNLLGAPYNGLPRCARWARLKEWQAVQLSTPELFINLALFDAKLMSLVQVKIYDRARGEKYVFERQLPPGQMRIADSLYHSKNAYDGPGALLCFDNHIEDQRIHVVLDVAQGEPVRSGKHRPRISGRFSLHYDLGAPQIVSQPFASGGMYSHKGMFPVSGYLALGDQRIDLAPSSSLALLDDHKGYYPYVMRWDWLTSAKVCDDGVPRGFNLTRNQCSEPERYNENCVWEGDRVGALPPVQFERQRRGQSTEQWRVTDREGRVDVLFTPSVPGDVRVNALVIESRYRGPFGNIEGHLAPFGLPELELSGWFGMGEEFYLRC